MPIPPYDQLMLPVLRLSAEHPWAMRELVARMADDLNLTQAEREQEIPRRHEASSRAVFIGPRRS